MFSKLNSNFGKEDNKDALITQGSEQNHNLNSLPHLQTMNKMIKSENDIFNKNDKIQVNLPEIQQSEGTKGDQNAPSAQDKQSILNCLKK